MFYRVALKWLIISVIVLIGFVIILLFLGYLLKENEAKTTQLKAQLEQEAYQQQQKENRKNTLFPNLKIGLSPAEKSQQKIIANNLYCQSNKQCFLVHTNSQALGCIVAVNTTGAAILLKVAAEHDDGPSLSNSCQQEYDNQHKKLAQCRNNLCSF